jgi:hypothetical protein
MHQIDVRHIAFLRPQRIHRGQLPLHAAQSLAMTSHLPRHCAVHAALDRQRDVPLVNAPRDRAPQTQTAWDSNP